jgi:hypothetical protein
MYDVQKSVLVADIEPGWYSLYKTNNGNYFVTSNKSENPVSDWFFRYDSFAGFTQDINPLTKEEVIEFLNRLKRIDLIKQEFPDLQDA